MEAQVVNGEFTALKDTVWKLSSRVLLLEGFIKKQFGSVFWTFCEDQVHAAASGIVIGVGGGIRSDSASDDEADSVEASLSPTALSLDKLERHEKVLPLPPMIPIYTTVVANPNITISTTSSPANTAGGAVIVNKTNKPIPPPPPLSCMKSISSTMENSNSSSSSYHHKPRNFLPKSLAAKPKVVSSSVGGNGSSSGSVGREREREREAISFSEDLGAANSSDSSADSFRYVIKTEGPNYRKSPATPMQISKSSTRTSLQLPQLSKHPAAIPMRKSAMSGNNFRDSVKVESDSEEDQDQYQDHYQDQYQDQDQDMQDDLPMDGFSAAELVAANLATSSDAAKRMKYSFATSSSSLNGTTPRQMRPNPCHTRCQNRCHDIWTDGDRMGVFETYWSIPNEEERREWVAQRIERVDMATKRTEFSNFRTCTFKYYLPHPDNPWVQVCKNFFLATIDEKRSYIEKIAQSVKGDAEKMSAKDIPFRRRNQMRGMEYVGWMTGVGGEPVDPDTEVDMQQMQMAEMEDEVPG